jgi:hypothetical protein
MVVKVVMGMLISLLVINFNILAGQEGKGKEYDLSWKFTKGEKFMQKIKLSSESMEEGKVDVGVALEVISVNKKGRARFRGKIKYLKVKIDIPGVMQFEFDSTKKEKQVEDEENEEEDEDNPMREVIKNQKKAIARLLKAELRGVINRKGRQSAWIRGAQSAPPLPVPETSLPGKKVKIGDKWEKEINLPMLPVGRGKYDMESTFTKIEELDGVKCAVIEAVEIIEEDEEDEEEEDEEEKVKMVTYFDLKNQRVLKIKGKSLDTEFEVEYVYGKQ